MIEVNFWIIQLIGAVAWLFLVISYYRKNTEQYWMLTNSTENMQGRRGYIGYISIEYRSRMFIWLSRIGIFNIKLWQNELSEAASNTVGGTVWKKRSYHFWGTNYLTRYMLHSFLMWKSIMRGQSLYALLLLFFCTCVYVPWLAWGRLGYRRDTPFERWHISARDAFCKWCKFGNHQMEMGRFSDRWMFFMVCVCFFDHCFGITSCGKEKQS